MKTSSLIAAVAALVGVAQAHSWIEAMYVVENGQYVGEAGFPRGYVSRSTAGGQQGDYLIPAQGTSVLSASDLVCSPKEQDQKQMIVDEKVIPRLKASPGSYVAIRYLENGHVTFIANEIAAGKKDSGLNFIYGTTKYVPGQSMLDVFKWTTDDPLDKGRLLTSSNFDDQRCFENNKSPIALQRNANPTGDVPCESHFQIPEDVKPGSTFTVFWVWDWPTPKIKDQIYTSCMDIDIIETTKLSKATPSDIPVPKAVPDYKDRANDKSVKVRVTTVGGGAPGPAPGAPPAPDAPATDAPAPPPPGPDAPAPPAPAPAPPGPAPDAPPPPAPGGDDEVHASAIDRAGPTGSPDDDAPPATEPTETPSVTPSPEAGETPTSRRRRPTRTITSTLLTTIRGTPPANSPQ